MNSEFIDFAAETMTVGKTKEAIKAAQKTMDICLDHLDKFDNLEIYFFCGMSLEAANGQFKSICNEWREYNKINNLPDIKIIEPPDLRKERLAPKEACLIFKDFLNDLEKIINKLYNYSRENSLQQIEENPELFNKQLDEALSDLNKNKEEL